MFQMKVVCILC